MKKFIFTMIIILILMVTSPNISAFTYDGDINPNEFLKWLVVSSLEVDEYVTTIWVKNPDVFAEIKLATLHLIGGGFSWYTYWKYSTLYTFEYSQKTDKFELVFVLKVE